MEKDRVTPLIGSGADLGPGIMTLLATMKQAQVPVVQFFNGSPDFYGRRKLDHQTAREALYFMQQQGSRVFAHCPFVINLSKDPQEEPKSLKAVHADIDALGKAGISSVCHIGHHLNKFSIETVCRTLSCLDFWGVQGSYPLLLENAAGDGTELGVGLDELRFLAQNTDPRIGFCIDTQHAFAGMNANLKTIDGVNEFLKSIDAAVGLGRVRLFHLNDSEWQPGAKGRKDKHAPSNVGHIWGIDSNNQAALKHLVLRGAEMGIPFVTETDDLDPARIYDLLNRA